MEKNQQTKQLTMDLARRAIHGDREVMNEIIRIYEPFHDSLLTYEGTDAAGRMYREINEDWKILVQIHMLDAIQRKWRNVI